MVFPLYNALLKENNMKLFLLVSIMSLIISVSVYIMKFICIVKYGIFISDSMEFIKGSGISKC